MGGVLFAHFLGTMTANTFYLDLTFVTLTMLVVGGMRSLTGACVGVALVSIVVGAVPHASSAVSTSAAFRSARRPACRRSRWR